MDFSDDFPHPHSADEPESVDDRAVDNTSNGERREASQPHFERALADFVNFGRSMLDREIARPIGDDLKSRYVVDKMPYGRLFFIHEALREYGLATEYSDSTRNSMSRLNCGGFLIWQRAGAEEDLTDEVDEAYLKDSYLTSFIGELTSGMICEYHISTEEEAISNFSYSSIRATIPGQKDVAEAEKAGYHQEMLIKGFMTSAILAHLDFSELSGTCWYDGDWRHREGRRLAYEHFAEQGYKPFNIEQLHGMLQAEFVDLLEANPELKAKLEAHAKMNAGTAKPKSNDSDGFDYGLSF